MKILSWFAARRQQRALVHEVREVGTRHARRATRERRHVDVVGDRLVPQVHAENAFAAAQVGRVDDDLPVETPRTQQRRIEHVGAVGGGDEDHAVVRLEAVHLDEQLVQRLLALVVPAAQAGAAVATDGVDLVDEDDARRVRLALLEQVAHAAGADADEHLHEVGARHREERTARLAGDRLGEQRLARARRTRRAARPSAAVRRACVNFCGSFRNSMISWSSTLASSQPATSANVTLGVSPVSSFALDLPNENALFPPACIWRSRKTQNPMRSRYGRKLMKKRADGRARRLRTRYADLLGGQRSTSSLGVLDRQADGEALRLLSAGLDAAGETGR